MNDADGAPPVGHPTASVPLVAVQGAFNISEAVVEPGTRLTLAILVTNLGDSTESFVLTPTGMAAGWTSIRPAYVTLFGGSSESVDVEVTAPRLPSTTAGPTALGVRIVPQSQPDDVVNAETTLHIAPTFDRRVTMLQPAVRTRRRATFEAMIENLGNVQASCRMHLAEPTGRLDGDFDPPAVGIEPGGSTLVRLRVRARRRQWERRSRSIPFAVEADQQGTPTVSAAATFVQAPVLPERLWSRVAGLALLGGALAGLWFGVITPEIRRAAERAVDDVQAPTDTSVSPVTPISAAPTSVPPTIPPTGERGEPFSSSLPSGAKLSEQSTQTYTVPDGSTLLITQYIVQNPFGDEGSAVLRLGTLRFEYDLANLDGLDANQGFVDPVQLNGGDTITFEVSCGAIGRAGAETCSPSVTVIGRLIATDDVGV
jgi:hypothetical protein